MLVTHHKKLATHRGNTLKQEVLGGEESKEALEDSIVISYVKAIWRREFPIPKINYK